MSNEILPNVNQSNPQALSRRGLLKLAAAVVTVVTFGVGGAILREMLEERSRSPRPVRPHLLESERGPGDDIFIVYQGNPIESEITTEMLEKGYRNARDDILTKSDRPVDGYQQVLDLPPYVSQPLDALQALLNQFHGDGKSSSSNYSYVNAVHVFDNPEGYKQFRQDPLEHANPDSGLPEDKFRLIIFIVLNHDLPISVHELLSIVFHENMHVFNGDYPTHQGEVFGTRSDSEFQHMFKVIRSQAIQRALDAHILRPDEVEMYNGLIDVSYNSDSSTIMDKVHAWVDNASDPPAGVLATFCQESGFGQNYGHVIDSGDELFASTLNVLHSYPKSWIDSIKQLTPTEQAFMKNLAKKVLNILRSTISLDRADQMISQFFSQEVRDFIGY